MNATIPMLLVSTVAAALAPRSAAQEPGQPSGGSRRPVDVSVEGFGGASRRAPGNRTGNASIRFSARPSTGGLDTPLDCPESIADQATGGCLHASSTPTLGMLYPYPGINNVFASRGFVGGGENNQATGSWSTVGGGINNEASGSSATVAGGVSNRALGFHSTVGGGRFNTAHLGQGPGFFSGRSTVAGGSGNIAYAFSSTVGGGSYNTTYGRSATVAGGRDNEASGDYATIAGGESNDASALYATIGGGYLNIATAQSSTVAGGDNNTASGSRSTVGGGFNNSSSGHRATVPGGWENTAKGNHSFAAGRRAKANHNGAFVWGDTQDVDKPSSAPDQFNVYCRGGARFFSNATFTAGVLLAPGGSTWTMVSDRDAKENVEPVDARAVLDKVSQLPLATWNYKAQDDSIRHMGPMAQDFYAAFGLGLGGETIDTIDPNGVALAAIQGLNAELEELRAEKDAEIEGLKAQLSELASRLDELTARH